MFEDLKIIKNSIDNAKSDLVKLKRTGMYSESYLNEKAQEFMKGIKKERDSFLTQKKESLQTKMNSIIEKYNKPLTDAEVNRELLRIKKLETEIKFMDYEDLAAIANNYINTGKGDAETLNLVGAELLVRGEIDNSKGMRPYKTDLAKELKKTMTTKYNIKEPWQNDNEFKAAEKELVAAETVSKHDDYVYISLGTPEEEQLQLSALFSEYGTATIPNLMESISRKNQLFELKKAI